MGPAGATALASALERNRTLKHLWLSGTILLQTI